MAAPGKGSKWGSFLASAVTGVESRLDNMLSEAEGAPGVDDSRDPTTERKKQQQPERQAPMSMSMSVPSAASNSRSSSNNRGGANDRLQARLAKAMAGKGSQGDSKGLASPRHSIDGRSSTDRPSIEVANGDDKDDLSTKAATAPVKDSDAKAPSTIQTTPTPYSEPVAPSQNTSEQGAAEETTTPREAHKQESLLTADCQTPNESTSTEQVPPAPSISPSDLSNLAKDMDEIKTRQQEEIEEYVERIDSLQSKLQYLSRKEAESAKKAANAAPSGSAERKIAERDEKIALLMEEGQKLSSSEGKFRATIKRLRQQMAEHEKRTNATTKEKEKAISDLNALRTRLDGNEEKEKRQEEARKATTALQKEIDSLKKERATKDEAMRKMEQDLKAKTEKAEAASLEAHKKELAAELERYQELEKANADLKAENESLADKTRLERLEWSEKAERAAERSRATEAEMKNELKMMENKLEAMRSAAEEASSGTAGEGQIKLIRQIETLQSQYSTASDNWQGIEASLLAKAANLEKEKDEAQRRESEMRKKARDAASRSRKLEDDLQELQPDLTSTKQELESVREQIAALRTSSKSTETALEQARADLERQQRAAAREFQEDQSRRQWADDVPNHPSPRMQSRPESPLLPLPRTFSSDLAGFQAPSRSRRTPVGSIPDSPLDGPRRLSSQPPGRSSALSPVSGQPPTPFSTFEPPSQPSEIASPSLAGRDDQADDKVPSSPRNVAQDMISVSTVGAGPSVQLVERMSAAIRRLEGEKVAAKEEMTRVCSQRDEARSEMVGLMKEVESAKTATSKVEQLEKELADINARYQTTLEMLGEKSELVEELRADVQDVKAMYRELVERTVK